MIMAITKSISISLLLIVSLIILIPPVTSASSSSSSSSSSLEIQFLNVHASLQRAHELISSSSTPTKLLQAKDPLSLPLHSRSSNHAANNYTALTLSRLARDQARVNSLLSPSKSTGPLTSPVTSGVDEGSGEYFVQVGVGRPVEQYLMVLDTGSDITWLQCLPCLNCYPQSEALYNAASSATYRPLPCSSPQCSALENPSCLSGECLYEVDYGDGSYTSGNFATETLSFGSSGYVSNVAIGCGHDNGGMYSGAAGLMGLGGGELSLPSQINATSFSYCLVNRDSNSSSTLDFNSARLGPGSVTAPLMIDPDISTYRFVGLTGISVGGRPVRFQSSLLAIQPNGSGGVIVDSGTTVTRFIDPVYESVRDAFRRQTKNLPFVGGFSILDTCYDLSGKSNVSVPTMSFQFCGGGSLALSPENYLIPVDDMGTFCFAFAGTNESPSIIGNVQQQEIRVTYDLAKKIIAFTPNQC